MEKKNLNRHLETMKDEETGESMYVKGEDYDIMANSYVYTELKNKYNNE